MLALASSTHFSWSLKLSSFIMLNILDALDENLRGDSGLSNSN